MLEDGEDMVKNLTRDIKVKNERNDIDLNDNRKSLNAIMQSSFDLITNNTLMEISRSKEFIKVVKSSIPKKEYKLVLNGFYRNQLKEGSLKLMNNKDGGFYPVLVNPKTKRIIKNIPIKETFVNSENLQAMQNYKMQMQLNEISNQLKYISSTIKEIKQGQINDRLAKAYSTEEDFHAALVMTDPSRKKAALLSIAHSATESRQALMLQQEESFKFFENLPDSKLYDIFHEDKSLLPSEIDNRFRNIKITFQTIHKLSVIQSVAYQEYGETESAKNGLLTYAKHIKKMYLEKYILLELLRLNSDIDDTFWYKALPQVKDSSSYLLNEHFELPYTKISGIKCAICGKDLGDTYIDKLCPKCKRGRNDKAKKVFESTKKVIKTVVEVSKVVVPMVRGTKLKRKK